MLMITGFISAASVWDHPKWHAYNQVLYVLLFMDILLMIIILPFIIIHSFLVFQGKTTVELFAETNGSTCSKVNYELETTRDCLFQAFGSTNVFEMLGWSIIEPVLTGIEWSFWQKELGFDEFGEFESEEYRRRLKEKIAKESAKKDD